MKVNSSIIVCLPCPSCMVTLNLCSTAPSLHIPVLIAYNLKKDYSTNLLKNRLVGVVFTCSI